MAVTFTWLRDINLDALGNVAQQWTAFATQLSGWHSQLDSQVIGVVQGGAWRGSDADAATPQLAHTSHEFDAAHDEAAAFGSILSRAQSDLSAPQTALRAAIHDIQAAGFVVDDNGTVGPPPGGPQIPPPPANGQAVFETTAIGQLRDQVQGFQDRIDAALHQADEADTRAAWAIRSNLPHAGPSWLQNPASDDFNDHALDGSLGADTQRMLQLMAIAPSDLTDDQLHEVRALIESDAGNPDFATPLLQKLGPRGLLAYEGQLQGAASPSAPKVPPGRLDDMRQIQTSLGITLATATGSPDVTGPGPRLDQSWVQGLIDLGNQKIDVGQHDYTILGTQMQGSSYKPYGYQLLGPLLDNGTYNADFLNQVGSNMIALDRDDPNLWNHNRSNQSIDMALSGRGGFDPLIGLMNAMNHNPTAAQQFFDPANPTGNNLYYLLAQRKWPDDDPHTEQAESGMTELSHAIDAASTGTIFGAPPPTSAPHDAAMARIASQTIAILGNPSAKMPPEMQPTVSDILSSYIEDVHNGLVNVPTTGHVGRVEILPPNQEAHAYFDTGDLHNVLAGIAPDEEAYSRVVNAEMALTALGLHTQQSLPGPLDPTPLINDSAFVMGVLDHIHTQNIKDQQTADDAHQNNLLHYGSEWLNNAASGLIADTVKNSKLSDLAQRGVSTLIDYMVTEGAPDTSAEAAQRIAYVHGTDLQYLRALVQTWGTTPNASGHPMPTAAQLDEYDAAIRSQFTAGGQATAQSEGNP